MSIRLLPVALVAVLIALVTAGGAALAFGIGGGNSEATDDLMERAATELGVDAQALKDALSQAQSEIRDQRQQEMLAKLVADEVITQDQANEASIWLDQMPASVNKLMRPELLLNLAANAGKTFQFEDSDFLRFRLPGLYMGEDPDNVIGKMADILGVDPATLEEALKNARQFQQQDARVAAIDDLINKLVEDGQITTAEGDEIKAWIDAMPEWLQEPGLLHRIFSIGFSNMFSSARVGPGFPHDPAIILPQLDELRDGRRPFFFGPEGAFELPRGRFDFRAPGDGHPESRFFYRGPEGEFNFDWEIPPEFAPLLDQLNGRFGEGFDFSDLEGMFEHFPRFRSLEPFGVPPAPESPDEGSDTAVAAKDA